MEKITNGFQTNYVLNYGDILATYSDGFLDTLLRIGIVLSFFNLLLLFYFSNIETPGWAHYFKTEMKNDGLLFTQLLKSGALVSFIGSMFLVVVVIYYKMGWY